MEGYLFHLAWWYITYSQNQWSIRIYLSFYLSFSLFSWAYLSASLWFPTVSSIYLRGWSPMPPSSGPTKLTLFWWWRIYQPIESKIGRHHYYMHYQFHLWFLYLLAFQYRYKLSKKSSWNPTELLLKLERAKHLNSIMIISLKLSLRIKLLIGPIRLFLCRTIFQEKLKLRISFFLIKRNCS